MLTSRHQLGITLLFLGALGLVLATVKTDDEQAPPDFTQLRAGSRHSCFVHVIFDGDTIGCDLNHNGVIEKPAEHVRFLGIDAPEMHYSKRKKEGSSQPATNEPYAAEATGYVKTILLKQSVYLEFDVQRSDRYGRTLAYVYLNPRSRISISETLLKKGLARSSFFEPNIRYKPRFLKAEKYARQEGLGLWQEPLPSS